MQFLIPVSDHITPACCFTKMFQCAAPLGMNSCKIHKAQTFPFFHLLASLSLLPFHPCQSGAVLCAEAREFTSLTTSQIIYHKWMLLFIQLSSFTQYLQGSGLDENWKCQDLQINLTPQLQRGFPNNQFRERTACSKGEQGPRQYMKKKETEWIWEICGIDTVWKGEIIQYLENIHLNQYSGVPQNRNNMSDRVTVTSGPELWHLI